MSESGQIGFGIKVPTLSDERSRGVQFIDKIIRFIQDAGDSYDTIWVSDHLMSWVAGQRSDADTLECWTTICYLAGFFKKYRFGSAVLCNSFRSPMLLAKMVATIHSLTRGRYVFGIGAGWSKTEYFAYGYNFPNAVERIKQLEEAVQIVRKMWSEDELFFKGKYYQVNGAKCFPRPVPPPSIMIGGGGEKLTLKVVAEYADWWNVVAMPSCMLEHKISVLKGYCLKVGRDFNTIKKTIEVHVAIAETKKEAENIASRGQQAHSCGTPEEILNQFKNYLDLGFDYYLLRFIDQPSPNGARMFAEQVIPELSQF